MKDTLNKPKKVDIDYMYTHKTMIEPLLCFKTISSDESDVLFWTSRPRDDSQYMYETNADIKNRQKTYFQTITNQTTHYVMQFTVDYLCLIYIQK